MTATAKVRGFFGWLFKPEPDRGCKITVEAVARLEKAAKRVEDSADSFGDLVTEMRGKRTRSAAKKKPSRKP